MHGLNKVQLIGALARDAVLRHSAEGIAMCTVVMGTTGTGERAGATEWHRVVLWGKQAELLARYLVKGKQLYVEGRLHTRALDKSTGMVTEIRAEKVILLGMAPVHARDVHVSDEAIASGAEPSVQVGDEPC